MKRPNQNSGRSRLKAIGLSHGSFFAYRRNHPNATIDDYIEARRPKENKSDIIRKSGHPRSSVYDVMRHQGCDLKEAIAILDERKAADTNRWVRERTGLGRDVVSQLRKQAESGGGSITDVNRRLIAMSMAYSGTLAEDLEKDQ